MIVGSRQFTFNINFKFNTVVVLINVCSLLTAQQIKNHRQVRLGSLYSINKFYNKTRDIELVCLGILVT